jgi:hypothetical protein
MRLRGIGGLSLENEHLGEFFREIRLDLWGGDFEKWALNFMRK